VPEDQVRAEAERLCKERAGGRQAVREVARGRQSSAPVVVERRSPRRFQREAVR
jgi:hypothetical protein